MLRQCKIVAFCNALLLADCAQLTQPAQIATKRGPVCETASGHATT